MNSSGEVTTAVEAVGVTRVFGDDGVVVALDDVSVDVHHGEFLAVQGPSGCGKSTLLHLLGVLDAPTAGKVLFEGADVAAFDDDSRARLRRTRIGIVLPVVDLVSTFTAWENVAISSLLGGRSMAAGRDRACDLLDRVKLGHRADAAASRLSSGEAQRVALARALFADPTLIIADEPTSFLDSVRSDEVVSLLRELADEGHAIVMATHDARAAAFADRAIRLLDGRIVGDS